MTVQFHTYSYISGNAIAKLIFLKDINLLLQKCGFTLKEHLNPEEMTTMYFSEYNNANPKYQIQAPDGVEYVYVVK